MLNKLSTNVGKRNKSSQKSHRAKFLASTTLAAFTAGVALAGPAAAVETQHTLAAYKIPALSENAQVVTDYPALNADNKVVELKAKGSYVTTQIQNSAPISEIVVGVRGPGCDGVAPQLAVSVNGQEIQRGSSRSSTYFSDFKVNGTLPAGKHKVTLSMVVDPSTSTCNSGIFLDQVKLKTSGTLDVTKPSLVTHFSTQGSTIYDPEGKVFLPNGVNMMGPRGFFKDTNTAAMVGAAQTWKFNTIRLNSCLNPTGCFSYRNWTGDHTNDNLDHIVKTYTDRKIVVMIAAHDVAPGAYPTAEQTEILKREWTTLAKRYADNPYVWFNTLNEPGKRDVNIPDQATYELNNAKWAKLQDQLIGSIRDTGAENMVVVDGSNYGQDNNGWVKGAVPAYSSAIQSAGPALHAKYENLLFSVHVYNSFGQGATSSENIARLGGYLDNVKKLGLPIVIGETGSDPSIWHANAPGYAAIDAGQPRGVGVLAWHGQAQDAYRLVNVTGTSSIDRINATTWPSNLTPFGSKFWQYAKNN